MDFILNKSPFIIPLIITSIYAIISYTKNGMADNSRVTSVLFDTATLTGGIFLVGHVIFPNMFKNIVGLEIYMICGGVGSVNSSINGLIKKFKNIKVSQETATA